MIHILAPKDRDGESAHNPHSTILLDVHEVC
jgi:hypothetical protein